MTDPSGMSLSAAAIEVTVYVVERGCYSDRYVYGVYGSLAEAKEGLPHEPPGDGSVKWSPTGTWWSRTDPDGWTEDGRRGETSGGRWSNGLDWGNAVTITAHTLSIRPQEARRNVR